MDFNNIAILDTEPDFRTRKFSEAVYINKFNNTINENENAGSFNSVYKNVIVPR